MFGTVLIANRGEIALRVARTCRELGIRTVAVYSTADRDSAVVRFADESVHIGPPPSRGSYLHIPAVIEAAKRTGAEAIHPGYGFLSENPDFAEVCEDEGIVFIGPPAAVMQKLGDKAVARSMMVQAGLPLLPGSTEAIDTVTEAQALADSIGYPVIIKAAAGGGGRGMRIVRDAADFARAYRDTRLDAQAVFGDGRVYVERYLESARHVEIQVLADRYRNAVHLGARDCSVQRRHQKLVEESPPPGLPDSLVAEMGAAAVRATVAAGYVGAGTFEFLVDTENRYYFMEVNCRLQVEHPVTEMVTRLDLVAEQLRVAAGQPLGYGQEDVACAGHSIECRINAEDPARGFAPAPATVRSFVAPGGPFVRVDTHLFDGYRIPSAYDSLLAKVVVWGPDRAVALARMRAALTELRVDGPGAATTAEFLHSVMDNPVFREGKHDTSLVGDMLFGGSR
ncbi:acetyl-CoA carboxylase biotin carboxylase subunit [Actinokineospora auranticolor]|uniref:Biotin carboxylase n=1 Tax=Actinokineospora auranticolor TaxID=155976 RepID=A0A2S6GI40_9PSEU|nr:acetyl-CoA carboxylase biotin carboxylase subunit [Actinokineospora auranticolor]PPK64898.1 acetyl-CoA carboxylase biotin carboxylase subunit [Actinokineospora auranticolor]